jgi:fibronectin-binding autotransporter adhesin
VRVGGALAGLIWCGVQAQTWGLGAGGSWAVDTNWNPNVVPNAAGAAVTFDTPTAARVVTVDSGAAGFTVGSITINNDSAFTNALQVGTAGSNLKLDNGGLGVTLTFNGTGPSLANTAVSAAMVFNDNVTAMVNYASNSTGTITTQGAFNWTGQVTGGTGGFTKQGPFVMTMGTAQKQYTGPTVFDTNSGRTRISVAGRPSQTSSVTVKEGAQIELITAGTYSFGTGPLNLNGTGLGPGSVPGNFPGAIRPASSLATTITNPVVLQTDSLIHVQGAAAGSMTLSGVVSGPGRLAFTALNSNEDLGTLILSGANMYTGGTTINGGTLTALAPTSLGATTGELDVSNRITVLNPSTTQLNLSTLGPTTVGSLSGTILNAGNTATINTGGQLFTVNQTANGAYQGTIAGSGGFTLGSLSTQTLTLTGAHSYSGNTTIEAGTLLVDGSISAVSVVAVSGGTLGGNGIVGGVVVVNNGGTLTAGTGAGNFAIGGDLSLNAGSTLAVQLANALGGAPVAGSDYGRINVGSGGPFSSTGSVTIAGNLALTIGAGIIEDDLFFILVNDGTDAISGNFSGLPQNSEFVVSGQPFRISYTADFLGATMTGGNDVALLAVPEPGALAMLLGGFGLLVGLQRFRRQV